MSEKTSSQSDVMESDSLVGLESIQHTLDTFLETADVERVYGEPVQHGDTLVIPTAEVLVAMGFGLGYGAGSGSGEGEDGEEVPMSGEGGGGGGAGRTLSRPVAVVIASPQGVRVEPVVDVTKIGLAFLTAAGFMLATLMRMRRSPRYEG